jgi:hypothetical protein
MKRRFFINLAALFVVFAGSYSLHAQKSPSPGSGACCLAPGHVCYVEVGDGAVVAFPGTRYC